MARCRVLFRLVCSVRVLTVLCSGLLFIRASARLGRIVCVVTNVGISRLKFPRLVSCFMVIRWGGLGGEVAGANLLRSRL